MFSGVAFVALIALFSLSSICAVHNRVFLISSVSVVNSVSINKSSSANELYSYNSVALVGNESKIKLVFFSVKIVSILFVTKNGRNVFYGNLTAILTEVKHSNHTILLIVIIISGVRIIPVKRLGIYQKLGNGVATITLTLKHHYIAVCYVRIVTAKHKENVSVLAHKLLPHFNAVICRIVANGIGRIRLIFKSSTVGGEIAVSINYYSISGVSRNYLSCPFEDVIVRTVIKEHQQILGFTNSEFGISVIYLSCLKEALALILDIGIHELRGVRCVVEIGVKAAAIVVITADEIIRKYAVELGYTRFSVFPLCRVRTVVCNITESEYVLNVLFVLVCYDPIVKRAVVISSSFYVVFNKILSISDHREGIRVILGTVAVLFLFYRHVNGRIGYIHSITVAGKVGNCAFGRCCGKIVSANNGSVVKCGAVCVNVSNSLCVENITISGESRHASVEIVLMIIRSVVAAK